MQYIQQIGTVNWSIEDIKNSIPSFLNLYKQRPLSDNQGGMLSPHMFATWFMLKKLNPKYVIESGIWKGQGTWLIENTLPDAKIICLDINLGFREYISKKATYFEQDFTKVDWSIIKNKSESLIFFDDHQNAFDRIKAAKKLGFKHFIFEDNYPTKQGDCYSLKKAFQFAGFKPNKPQVGIKDRIKLLIAGNTNRAVSPNKKDASFLEQNLKTYYEFPPVFKSKNTRWGDEWNEVDYPTPTPVYSELDHEYLDVFRNEAVYYTWICYAALA